MSVIISLMTTLEDIRSLALQLEGVTESLHFRLPTFKVSERGFITVQKDAAILALPQAYSEALAEAEPDKYEAVWRQGRYFVGLKVSLLKTEPNELQPMIREAWSFRRR